MEKVFDIPKWKWKSHIQRYCELDDLGTGFNIAEGYRIGHGLDANTPHAVGHGGLFWQSHEGDLFLKKSALVISDKTRLQFPKFI